MHSWLCRHADGKLEEYAESALARGIHEICFTPHMPFPGFRPRCGHDRLRMDIEEFDVFEESLRRVRTRYPGLTILMGLEAEWVDGVEEFLSGFLSEHPFDFVLMSVHFVSAWLEDEWVFGYNPASMSLRRRYREYFGAVSRGIESGLFDGIAHLDLIKQPGRPVLSTNRGDVERVLHQCRDSGMSMEINTSGLRKEVGETYPSSDVISLALETGVPLTIGSDAHLPSHVGFAFDRIKAEYDGKIAAATVRYRRRRMVRDDAAEARAG